MRVCAYAARKHHGFELCHIKCHGKLFRKAVCNNSRKGCRKVGTVYLFALLSGGVDKIESRGFKSREREIESVARKRGRGKLVRFFVTLVCKAVERGASGIGKSYYSAYFVKGFARCIVTR